MKGISLMEPFGTLCIKGVKEYETRVARSSAALTKYRGQLLICTSKKMHPYWDSWGGKYFPDEVFKKVMYDKGSHFAGNPIWLPGPGMIIGMVRLVAIGEMQKEHQEKACCQIYPDAKALKFEEPMELIKPIPLAGRTNGFHLGIFEVNIDPEELVFVEK